MCPRMGLGFRLGLGLEKRLGLRLGLVRVYYEMSACVKLGPSFFFNTSSC